MALSARDFSPAELRTLRDLATLFGEDVLVVGGAALRVQFGLKWRTTDDVDVYVAARGDAIARRLDGAGWTTVRDRELAHRRRSPFGCTVDVIPAGRPPGGDGAQRADPRGPELDVVGVAAAFRDRIVLPLGAGVGIGVAGAAGLLVLKASAYLDAPTVRPHDLQDIARLFVGHAAEDERRFEDDVLDAGVSYDDAGAFLLGRDVAAIVDDSERACVENWLAFIGEADRRRHDLMGLGAPGLPIGGDGAAWAEAKVAAFRSGWNGGAGAT